MTLRIHALDRGGWSASGQGRFDSRMNGVRLQTGEEGEVLAAVVSFNETISSVTVEANGLTATTPTLDTNEASFELSALDGGGWTEMLFTLASGQKRRLIIAGAAPNLRDSDYGRWSGM